VSAPTNAPSRIAALIAEQRQAERLRLRLAAIAAAVVSVAAVGLLGLSGWFIAGAALTGAAAPLAAQAFNYLLPSAVIRLLAILRTGARYVERVAGHEAALNALARLRPRLFAAIASGPPEQALAMSSGEASARLVQDVDAVQTLFVRLSAPWALASGAAAALALTALASPLAAALLTVSMIVAGVGSVWISRRLSDPAGRAAQVAIGALKDRLSALEAAAPEIKAYGLEGWASGACADLARDLDRSRVDLAEAGGWLSLWQAALTAVAILLVTVAAANAPSPLVALAILASLMGMESAAGLVGALHQNGAAAMAAARLDASFALPATEPTGRPPAGASLEIMGQRIAPRRRLGLVGPSGVGKTSLVERLVGLRSVAGGELRIDGQDAAAFDDPARRALFAYAAQDIRLIDGSVRDNLLLAGTHDEAELWRVLDDAALGERFRAEPEGLDTSVGPDGARLSGGERRRLGLARAYLRKAPWLVLDEPTEGLDPATETRVLAALDRRLDEQGQGLILVSHRVPPTRLCDKVIRLPHGADQTFPSEGRQGGASLELAPCKGA